MAKKRYSYVGVSVLLALLIPTPVLSDAPPHLIKQPFRNLDTEEYSTKKQEGQPQGGSKKKANQVQGINDPSSQKNNVRDGGTEGGGSKPAGITSIQEQKGNLGRNNPSSGVLTDEATQNSTNKPSRESSGRGISPPLPIPGQNNTSPSQRKFDSGNSTSYPVEKTQNGATQNSTNKPSGESSGTGMSPPLPIPGANNTSPSGRKDDQIPRNNQSQDTGKNNPSVLDSAVYSSALDSFSKNPFAWLPLLLLLGLLPLLVSWFRRRRRQQINKYVDQIFEQKISNNIGLIINKISNKQEFKDYIDQYVVQQIDQIFEQKIQNNIPLITHNIVNDNQELNQYIDQRLHHGVINNTRINNEIVKFVANSTEINNKFNKLSRDIDIKISSMRNEWNQTFISLVSQYADELIHIIGDKQTFNILIANLISVKLDELLNQIITTKNELIVIMNNADRHLYEWTLGELMAIKGCLSDRQVLAEQLVSFSAKLKTKLDSTPCVDIKTFKRFKPILIAPQQPEQVTGS
ncbi:hypothetical protein [Brasilonema sp. UFV-L1]|uniref:hypothetical protein n=1 Tax=Brasilonema sp. UFV-L1 TaxID=2234130 RepID=UPI00145D5E68|nr:hypothetical protein [Brasilonema sp. UFV-L1]NMG10841.1 hypothetical protein [Brasilonema sp. UFV-L1]